MKLILFLIILINLTSVLADQKHEWICSDKINIDIANGSKMANGDWIINVSDFSILLNFDINNIDEIIIIPIKYKYKKNKCEHKSIITKLDQRFHLKFYNFFNGHKLSFLFSASKPDFFNNGERDYMIIIRKETNNKTVSYFKNITVIEDFIEY